MLMNSQPTKRCFLSYADGHTDRQGALATGEDSSVDFMQQQQWWRRDPTNKQWFFFLSLSLSSAGTNRQTYKQRKSFCSRVTLFLLISCNNNNNNDGEEKTQPNKQWIFFYFFFSSLVQTEEDTDGAIAARVCLSPSFCWFQCNNYGGCRPNKQFPPKHSFLWCCSRQTQREQWSSLQAQFEFKNCDFVFCFFFYP